MILCSLIVAAAAKAGLYPSPPPDFAHPGSPHAPQFSFAGGNNDRPLLVVYVQFTDFATPIGRDGPFYANEFFGSAFGSVVDYFRANSFGKLSFSRAAETQGTANDGVVVVNVGSAASFRAQMEGIRGRTVVQAADPFVNYASFDRNADRKLTNDELIISDVRVASDGQLCGGTRGIAAGGALDGIDLSTHTFSETTTLTNRISAAHEISHQALDVQDFNYTEGSFDPHGTTCFGANDMYWGYNSWKKLHFGWITPTVVTVDGFYSIGRASTTGKAYILYDPAKGTNDYFVVENRGRIPGTYDKDASDSGLVIWRLDETRYTTGPIDLVSPASGAGAEAWDPSDLRTPQRLMSKSWKDGTASRLAVRAIGNRGSAISAYFDVRGPGVLTDAYGLGAVRATPGTARTISFAVANTGEAGDTFAFTLTGLPPQWTASTVRRTLAAGAGSTVTVQLVPAAGAHAGAYLIRASGRSISDAAVASSSTFRIAVNAGGSDFDADRRTDTAIWRPSSGVWWIVNSSSGVNQRRPWGRSGDVPVPADYDGDGRTDTAIWRPSSGVWWIVYSSNGANQQRHWGTSGDKPVPGDYDGDGKADTAIWRPSSGDWWIVNSSNGVNQRRPWGRSGDVPVPADYDGDGRTDTAIWRPSSGDWWIVNSSNGANQQRHWGTSGDKPVPGDYDRDGKADTAIWRPSTGDWWTVNSSTGANSRKHWGQSGDIPVA